MRGPCIRCALKEAVRDGYCNDCLNHMAMLREQSRRLSRHTITMSQKEPDMTHQKLILHEVTKCPYCWTTVSTNMVHAEVHDTGKGFFTSTYLTWTCPGCRAELKAEDLVKTIEPRTELWARRF